MSTYMNEHFHAAGEIMKMYIKVYKAELRQCMNCFLIYPRGMLLTNDQIGQDAGQG